MAMKSKFHTTRELKSIRVKDFIDDYIYRIDLDADYQREKIWSREDQEKLLDSIVKNIDIPKIYLARVRDSENFDYECIDGKQRMTALLNFLKPEQSRDHPLTVTITEERYSYKRLKKELPPLAQKIDDFELSFVIYPGNLEEEFIKEIFRRLQLGVRLNSGELLKTHSGTLRDFVYDEMGRDAPFLCRTKLSEKRFSRQFTLAQICINSFARNETGNFVRARYDDLEDFFKDKAKLDDKDENLERIREVLQLLDKRFEENASSISSRAVAVSAYLFVEGLYLRKESRLAPRFVEFFVALLDAIKINLKLLSHFEKPENSVILEEFQKYISQASVEPYAIKRRDQFLERAFKHYIAPKTKDTIIGSL
ncbi:MAG TPA: DUF262 domain-containing protein [Candidatus Dormibacteraeota bacterium]|nr:DUF262 domain-containing protein [Candidatus Dormibacteraeota bacterium]